MRQMSYSLVRLGLYEEMKAHLSREPSASRLLLAACIAGGLGGVAGNPTGAQNDHENPTWTQLETQL
jgi:dicarboxylate transporter 10